MKHVITILSFNHWQILNVLVPADVLFFSQIGDFSHRYFPLEQNSMNYVLSPPPKN